MTMQGVTPLLLLSSRTSFAIALAMGDSGTSTVLTRCERLPLRSLRQSDKPLQMTQYNTRDELIRDIGWSVRDINKHGGAGGLRRLPFFFTKADK